MIQKSRIDNTQEHSMNIEEKRWQRNIIQKNIVRIKRRTRKDTKEREKII